MKILSNIAAKITNNHLGSPKVCDDAGLKELRKLTQQLEEHEIETCNLENTYRQQVLKRVEMIMLTRPDGTIAYLSDNSAEVLGYKPEELVGTISLSTDKIIHPDDMSLVRKVFNESLSGGSSVNYRYRIVTKQGETKEIVHSWTPVYVNKKLHLIASIVSESQHIVSN